jgi:hypothetical protein
VSGADAVDELHALSRLLLESAPSAAAIERRAEESGLFADVDVDEDDPPELVDLELLESLDVRLEQLRSAFGPPTDVPPLVDRPPRVAFYVREPGKPASVAIFVSLDEDDEDRVRAIMLRRDEL